MLLKNVAGIRGQFDIFPLCGGGVKLEFSMATVLSALQPPWCLIPVDTIVQLALFLFLKCQAGGLLYIFLTVSSF